MVGCLIDSTADNFLFKIPSVDCCHSANIHKCFAQNNINWLLLRFYNGIIFLFDFPLAAKRNLKAMRFSHWCSCRSISFRIEARSVGHRFQKIGDNTLKSFLTPWIFWPLKMRLLHYTETSRNVYLVTRCHIPEKEDHMRNVMKISVKLRFDFLTSISLNIQFCWDVQPCLWVTGRTALPWIWKL